MCEHTWERTKLSDGGGVCTALCVGFDAAEGGAGRVFCGAGDESGDVDTGESVAAAAGA